VLVLDMIEILPPMGKYKYDTWRILLVKCYIDNFVHMRSCIRHVSSIASNEVSSRPTPLFNWVCSFIATLISARRLVQGSFGCGD
jgi:hypothetical protein